MCGQVFSIFSTVGAGFGKFKFKPRWCVRIYKWPLLVLAENVDMDTIDDLNDFISIATYLTKEEANSIKKALTAIRVDAVASGHDTGSRYQTLHYEIRVKRKDIDRARPIVERRRKRASLESQLCPKCSSGSYKILEKKGFWQNLYYYGTTLAQCKKCRTKYPI